MKSNPPFANRRRQWRLGLSILIAISITAACNLLPVEEPAPTFKMAVIVDVTTDPVSREEVEAITELASQSLLKLTGIELELVDFVESRKGGDMESTVNDFMSGRDVDTLPNGIVVFSSGETGRAQINRGYSFSVQGPDGFLNDFASPYTPEGSMYVGVLFFNYLYAPCGYHGTETIQSNVAGEGECRNVEEACVDWHGQQMCQSVYDELLHVETRVTMVVSPMVHEFMHPFSDRGPETHYSSAACNEIMGQPVGYFNFEESEYYNDICPDIYDVFVASYRP